jgi:hypothetical protein
MSKSDLTSYQDLIKDYQTAFISTPSGYSFEIQAIRPGNYMISMGGMLTKYLTQSGVDLQNQEAVREAIQNLDEEQQIELSFDEANITRMQKIVCAGVISMNFVDKPQHECKKWLKEVSIDLLPFADLLSLFTEIIGMSLPETEVADFATFRQDSKQNGSPANRGVSENVSQATESDTV